MMEAINKKITNMQARVERMKAEIDETYSDIKEELGTINTYLSDLYVAENTKQWSGFPVITLCGSARFKDEFLKVWKKLTLDGYIVLSVDLFENPEEWEDTDEDTAADTVEMLNDMHKRKIDMSDEIFVINPDGYIDNSTKDKIHYAKNHGKTVRYLTDEPAFN